MLSIWQAEEGKPSVTKPYSPFYQTQRALTERGLVTRSSPHPTPRNKIAKITDHAMSTALSACNLANSVGNQIQLVRWFGL